MSIKIRTLLDTDLENAEEILRSAFRRSHGWRADLLLYRKTQPEGYFLAEQDGNPVGMVGAIIYSTFAYVGLMAVHTEYQRKGIGLALMQHVLAWLDEQQVPFVLLDASPSGQPLYEKLGFTAYEKVEIFQRDSALPACPCPPRVKLLSISDLDLITAPDEKAFGADRSKVLRLLLETYPGRAFLLPDGSGQVNGYLFAQENRIGPWVMQDGREAEELLQAALSLPFPGPISVAVPGENEGAVSLLQRYGFIPGRVNRHMGRGSGAPTDQREKVFGQASLSLG
jgi:ribosomal protein S18 acetylase RimI-like enzyme